MTADEAKYTYGCPEENGYVYCDKCPLLSDFPNNDKTRCFGYDPENADGYYWCWRHIADCMTAKESDPCNGENDVVNHPAHYTQGGIECIDAMKAAFGVDELAIYCKIAAFKYVWRCEHKNGLEDLRKAVWYLNKFIELKGGGTDGNE